MRENIFLSCILVTFCVGLLISFSASWGYIEIISVETYQDSSVKSINSREHVKSSVLVYSSPNLIQSLECCGRIKNSHINLTSTTNQKPKVTLRVKITCATYSILPKYGTVPSEWLPPPPYPPSPPPNREFTLYHTGAYELNSISLFVARNGTSLETGVE